MMVDITKIERVNLEPGEVLHIKSGKVLTQNQVGKINNLFATLFPNNKTIISDQRVDISLETVKSGT